MNKEYAPRFILSLFGIMAIMLSGALSINVAHADEVSSGAQLSIGSNGQTMVRDAKVVAISGSTITAETGWGSTIFTWTVETTGSTKFFPEGGSKTVSHNIKVGDLVGFSGTLDLTTSHPTVRASVVRDKSQIKEGAVISGTILTLDSSSLTLSTETATTSVSVSAGTIITRDGDPVTLGELQIGDTIKIFGTLNLVAHTMVASKITYASALNDHADTKVAVGPGIFGRFLNWLHGSNSGAMTIK